MKVNKINRKLLLLVVILSTTCMTIADNSVHILGKFKQTVTSSTLNWLPIAHYNQKHVPVIGGFYDTNKDQDNEMDQETKQKPIYVCRARHNGVYVAGSQLKGEKHCTVTFLQSVKKYDNYDLLENIENSARLSWRRWGKSDLLPAGAVLTDTFYVARYPSTNNDDNNNNNNNNNTTKKSSYTHYIATLNKVDTFGEISYVNDDGKEVSVKSGEILVETEPSYYHLTDIVFNNFRKKILKNKEIIIAQEIIKNTRNKPANFAQELEYKYNYSSYWGHRPEMIKALNTSLYLKNHTQIGEIKWGMEEKKEQEDVYKVEIYLEPGTAVNLTLKANYTDYEIPYTGQLVSHYEDGESTTREINGIRREETLINLTPEAGPRYYLSNMSIVPTTLPPPTTTTIPTTTTTIQTTTLVINKIPSVNTPPSIVPLSSSSTIKVDTDENMIIPKNNANIQNDNKVPLSLKNRDRDSSGNNMTICLPIIFLSMIFINLYRIT